ncbi:hypothetical protein E2C01_072393 [Portunus trituberculatus]|uniref:Uncharacterized protein n=1 Tax=Portunus trituberculatus TaxID=210409 RepID=A0A5B7I711_PORTR|nr:hypothetical protein [Portunus trituberculatus]
MTLPPSQPSRGTDTPGPTATPTTRCPCPGASIPRYPHDTQSAAVTRIAGKVAWYKGRPLTGLDGSVGRCCLSGRADQSTDRRELGKGHKRDDVTHL